MLQERVSPQVFTSHTFLVFFASFFLVRSADSTLAYIFPIVVENAVGSNTIMGITMALSSIAGLACDFVFPSLLKGQTWKQTMVRAVVVAMLFPLTIYFGGVFSYAGLFIIATFIWGIYYELLLFSEQNYIVSTDKTGNFSKDWGILTLLMSVITLTTPIIASSLLISGKLAYTIFTLTLIAAAFVILVMASPKHGSEKVYVKSKNKEILRLLKEFKVWGILYKKVWQVLVVSLTLQCVFATYSIFGGLFGLSLLGERAGWVVMFLFALPGLVVYLMLSRMVVQQKKKLITHVAMMLGGLMLGMLAFINGGLASTAVIIFLSSLLFSVALPLNNAVFSDLAARLGNEKTHLFGMVNATGSVAFIIVPIVLGFLSDKWGYYNSFALMGFVTFVVGVVLLFTTPQKIRLPQKEIRDSKIAKSSI